MICGVPCNACACDAAKSKELIAKNAKNRAIKTLPDMPRRDTIVMRCGIRVRIRSITHPTHAIRERSVDKPRNHAENAILTIMKIVFSDHALIKIKQRRLVKSRIIDTVEHPDLTKPSYNLREERYKHFGKNWLKVIVINEHGALTVITAHWVEKAK